MDCTLIATGMTLSNMASGCPINNLIPEWNDLVYQGKWRDALDRLHKITIFLSSQVESVPIVKDLMYLLIEPPVTIKSIECSL